MAEDEETARQNDLWRAVDFASYDLQPESPERRFADALIALLREKFS
jgi:hypothetical protein